VSHIADERFLEVKSSLKVIALFQSTASAKLKHLSKETKRIKIIVFINCPVNSS
jgi:hypothetical protein